MMSKTSYERYEVTGAKLSEVSDAIFNRQNGKGSLSKDRTRRFAGKTRFGFQVRYVFRFNKATGKIRIAIKEISWETVVRLPKWRRRQMDAAPAAQKAEFRRFLAAVHKHELGHVFLYNFGMAQVVAALVDKPAGETTINAEKGPEYDARGNPRTDADRAIDQAMTAAAEALVENHAAYRDMKQKQDRYDAAPTGTPGDPDSVFAVEDPADQPARTDHGRTQGAVLRTP